MLFDFFYIFPAKINSCLNDLIRWVLAPTNTISQTLWTTREKLYEVNFKFELKLIKMSNNHVASLKKTFHMIYRITLEKLFIHVQLISWKRFFRFTLMKTINLPMSAQVQLISYFYISLDEGTFFVKSPVAEGTIFKKPSVEEPA